MFTCTWPGDALPRAASTGPDGGGVVGAGVVGGWVKATVVGVVVARGRAGLAGAFETGRALGAGPTTVAELFAQAADGVPAARKLVDAEAYQLGLTVASACAVFDPDLVVLGGGIGSNALLLPVVRETVRALVPFPPRVENSALWTSS